MDVQKGRDVLGGEGNRFSRRPAEHERDDLDPLLQPLQRTPEVDGHQAEQPHGEQRKGDRGDREGGEQRRAPERQQRLAREQSHVAASSSSPSSTALSNTTPPSRISMVR